jgi:hypothetical protein
LTSHNTQHEAQQPGTSATAEHSKITNGGAKKSKEACLRLLEGVDELLGEVGSRLCDALLRQSVQVLELTAGRTQPAALPTSAAGTTRC